MIKMLLELKDSFLFFLADIKTFFKSFKSCPVLLEVTGNPAVDRYETQGFWVFWTKYLASYLIS